LYYDASIGRAQEAALALGWLEADPARPEWLLLTRAGRADLIATRAIP